MYYVHSRQATGTLTVSPRVSVSGARVLSIVSVWCQNP